SPAESEEERNTSRKANRRTPMTPSHRRRKAKGRKLASRYTKDSYGRAIRRAAGLAEVNLWSPNQLRHSRATEIRQKFGIESASTMLGNGRLKTTAIYAERNETAAANIMRQIG